MSDTNTNDPGRPHKDRRDVRLEVRTTKREKSYWEGVAAGVGKTLSAFAREAMRAAVARLKGEKDK